MVLYISTHVTYMGDDTPWIQPPFASVSLGREGGLFVVPGMFCDHHGYSG